MTEIQMMLHALKMLAEIDNGSLNRSIVRLECTLLLMEQSGLKKANTPLRVQFNQVIYGIEQQGR